MTCYCSFDSLCKPVNRLTDTHEQAMSDSLLTSSAKRDEIPDHDTALRTGPVGMYQDHGPDRAFPPLLRSTKSNPDVELLQVPDPAS